MNDDNNRAIQLYTNALSKELVDESDIRTLTEFCFATMKDGYRLAFAILIKDGVVNYCILLLAPVDRATSLIETMMGASMTPSKGPTHILLFIAYADERQWSRQVDVITRWFPEQPDCAEALI